MITVCMIVKDEEKIIEKSLKSIVNFGLEIVVFDTGSKDNTKKIAAKYTSNIFDYKWCNNFSFARNFALSKVKSEYVLVLDADETIKKVDFNVLNNLVLDNKHNVGRILRINTYTRNKQKYTYKERVNRLFKVSDYKYSGSIHEQITSIDNEYDYKTYNIPIEVDHNGYEYDEIERKDKIGRNITLLKNELKCGKNDPYIIYQLGKSYYMKEDYKEAQKYFIRAMEFDLDTKLEYVQDMIESYGYALINMKEYDKALDILNLYDEFKISCDFIFLCGLIYMNNGLFSEAISEFRKATTYGECKMEGVNDYIANYNIGVIYECIGKKEQAYDYYNRSKTYDLSQDALKRLMIRQ